MNPNREFNESDILRFFRNYLDSAGRNYVVSQICGDRGYSPTFNYWLNRVLEATHGDEKRIDNAVILLEHWNLAAEAVLDLLPDTDSLLLQVQDSLSTLIGLPEPFFTLTIVARKALEVMLAVLGQIHGLRLVLEEGTLVQSRLIQLNSMMGTLADEFLDD